MRYRLNLTNLIPLQWWIEIVQEKYSNCLDCERTIRLSDYQSLLKDAHQDNSWLNDVFAFLHKSNAVFLNSSFFIFGKFSLAPTEAWQSPTWSYACLIDPRDI